MSQNDDAGPTQTPSGSVLNLGSYFSISFERVLNDDTLMNDWVGLTLLDTVETFFDARIDLFERKIKQQKDRIQSRAAALAKAKIRTNAEELDKEVQKFKLKISKRLTSLTEAWHSAKVIRTREKFTFFMGVMNVMCTSLLFGLAPEWIHVAYTVQALYLIPLRCWEYKRKNYTYFLADLCYFANVLTLIYLWVIPWSAVLFTASYCLTHGSLATAIITWRNSLVFHDGDKMTSLFIHMYPPLVLTVIRHFYKDAGVRFPAVTSISHLEPIKALIFSCLFYLLWQGLYWKLVLVDRREKIQSGLRTTSFSYLLNDKHGSIGRMLRGVGPAHRETYFMMGQFGYHILTELPAIFVLYDSPNWSFAFLMLIFAVSVWNGGGYYIEVFGRKFERELEALRQELAASQSSQYSDNGSATPIVSQPGSPRRASKDGEKFTALTEPEDDTMSSSPTKLMTEDTAPSCCVSQSEESPDEGEELPVDHTVMDQTSGVKGKSD